MSPLEPRPQRPLVVKFGGTSVGDGERFTRAARIAAEAASHRPVVVVVSAMGGTTDTLLRHARMPSDEAAKSSAALHRALAGRHLEAAEEAVDAEHLTAVEERVLGLLGGLVEAVGAPSENPKARRDRIAVYGERLSAEILAGAIKSQGISAAVAEDPIATDGNFGEAEVDAAATRERCTRHVEPLLEEGLVAVVPGYVGRSPGGAPTTLGRGGSDLSATVLGRALGSGEVWIMTDVDGVLDADPRLVPDAALMPRLSYTEAGTFAGLGAKVLHPRTMEPASEAGIEVFVRNSFAPEGAGTRVTGFDPGAGVRCVALRPHVPVEIPCTDGRQSHAAMVVCIGSPDDEDLARGLRCLREAGIPPLHFGIAAAGLVFLIPARSGVDALRALHAGLIPQGYAGEEVA